MTATDRAKELIAEARELANAEEFWEWLGDLATLAEQAIARAEKAEADLAEARRMLKGAENELWCIKAALREGDSDVRAGLVARDPSSDPSGTYACPICGKDTPHSHAPDEIARHQAREGR